MEDAQILAMNDLTDSEKLMFQNEFNAGRKSPTVGILLALLLGGIGAHRFYMGQIGLGVIYLLLVWTFIPAIIALFECFFMPSRVKEYNNKMGMEIATKIKSMRK